MAQSEPIARPQSRSAAGTAEARILLPRGHNSTGGVAAVLLSTGSAQHKPRHPIDVPCRRPKGVDRPNVLAARSDEMPGLPLLKNALEILCPLLQTANACTSSLVVAVLYQVSLAQSCLKQPFCSLRNRQHGQTAEAARLIDRHGVVVPWDEERCGHLE